MKERELKEGELYEARFGFKDGNANFRFLCVILAAFLLFIGLRLWWVNTYGGVVVEGNSMNKTLRDEDKLLMQYVDKSTKAKRGDIIVVYVGGYEECANVASGFLIKRLIATAGDKLYCTDGQIYICYAGEEDFEPLKEEYAYYGVNDRYKAEYDFETYEVGEGEVFFLGDNRSWEGSSVDSRYQQYPNGSHLRDRLYLEKDVYGVVPAWSVKHRVLLEKLFF